MSHYRSIFDWNHEHSCLSAWFMNHRLITPFCFHSFIPRVTPSTLLKSAAFDVVLTEKNVDEKIILRQRKLTYKGWYKHLEAIQWQSFQTKRRTCFNETCHRFLMMSRYFECLFDLSNDSIKTYICGSAFLNIQIDHEPGDPSSLSKRSAALTHYAVCAHVVPTFIFI